MPTDPLLEQPAFLALAETISSLIALIQGDEIVYMNPAGRAILGYPPDQYVGRKFWDFVHADSRAEATARGRARQAGIPQPKRFVERLATADGREVWMDYSIDVLVLDGETTTLVTGYDVTARQLADEALRHSEERFRLAFQNAAVGKAIVTPNLRFRQVNRAYCDIFGYTEKELLAMSPVDLTDDADDGDSDVLMRDLLQGGRPSGTVLKLYRHKSGRPVWGNLTLTLLRDARGEPQFFIGEVVDVTEHKRAEDALRSSEQRFRNLGTQAPVMMVGMDREGRIRSVSNYWLERMGYAHDEVVGRPGSDFITLSSHLALLQAFEERKRTNDTAVRNVPLQGIRKDGSLMDVILTAVVEFDDKGEPRGVITVGLDVSELNRADEALRRSEERFRGLFQNSPVMMCTLDAEHRIRDVNDCWTQAFGCAREEVVGREGLDFIAPGSRRRMEGGEPGERAPWVASMQNQPLQGVRKDGTPIDLLVTTVPELDEHGATRGLICVSIDVTALHENELRYRALVEWAPEAIIVAEADTGTFVDANANAEALFGMPREELLRQNVVATSPSMQANGRPSAEYAAEVIARAMRGETPVFEWIHHGALRREVPCRIHLSRLPAAGKNLVRATISDISVEKRLQEELRHQEKMAAMGVLAAGVAHEIGNPLLAMSMAAQSLERKTTDPYAQKKLALIGEHIDRISKIVRQMNDLSRPQSLERTRTCLRRTIERAIEIARFDKRAKDVELRLDLPDLPLVVAIEDQIIQVCLNLALNAFDAMAANPERRARILIVAACVEGDRVRVTFDDSGSGVSPEHGARLFQPFFTTKQPGKGTGLGLSVSDRIVRDHGGALTFENRREGGARFAFDLPLEARGSA